jgi:hypothetical protein
MDNIISYPSKIDSQFTVMIIYKDHELYNDLKFQLTELHNSIAALQVSTKNIIIDGEEVARLKLTPNDLLAIEAHEIAHSLIGHGPGLDNEFEKEADLLGIALLEIMGHTEASEVLKDKLEALYQIDYRQFESEFNAEADTDLDGLDLYELPEE